MKTAVVTGAAGGIGKTVCLMLSKAGYNVFGLDINEFDQDGITCMTCDVADETSVAETFNKIGKIHVLINNAAISSFQKPVKQLTPSEFSRIIDVNLKGAFNCTSEFLKANSSESYGRIINIASTRWNQNEQGWDAYGASKGGLVSFTSSLAVSLSDSPITVNAISPGWIQTSGYEALRKGDHRQHPSGRVGMPEDIGRMILFLCDKENDFINGSNIVIDGGMSRRMIYPEDLE